MEDRPVRAGREGGLTMFADLELIFESYKHLLGALAVLLTLGGFVLTIMQLNRNLKFQRETVAKTTYREYLQLCIAKPDLAAGRVMKASIKWEEYAWFVATLLWACEEIVEYARGNAAWMRTVRTQLGYHRAYLASDEFQKKLDLYTPRVRKLIDEVIAGGKEAEPIAPPTAPERPRYEPPKFDALKSDAPKSDFAKTESSKADPSKTETAKFEPAKTEPVKIDPPKFEPFKTEPSKSDPTKS